MPRTAKNMDHIFRFILILLFSYDYAALSKSVPDQGQQSFPNRCLLTLTRDARARSVGFEPCFAQASLATNCRGQALLPYTTKLRELLVSRSVSSLSSSV